MAAGLQVGRGANGKTFLMARRRTFVVASRHVPFEVSTSAHAAMKGEWSCRKAAPAPRGPVSCSVLGRLDRDGPATTRRGRLQVGCHWQEDCGSTSQARGLEQLEIGVNRCSAMVEERVLWAATEGGLCGEANQRAGTWRIVTPPRLPPPAPRPLTRQDSGMAGFLPPPPIRVSLKKRAIAGPLMTSANQ